MSSAPIQEDVRVVTLRMVSNFEQIPAAVQHKTDNLVAVNVLIGTHADPYQIQSSVEHGSNGGATNSCLHC